jgi:hypothetical protein
MFVLAHWAQLIESKAQESRPKKGQRSSAQVPFVVTKHQPSNGSRAEGHKRLVTRGAKTSSRLSSAKTVDWKPITPLISVFDNRIREACV